MNWREKYRRYPKVIAALERTRARVQRERRAAIAIAVTAAAGSVDVAVQLNAAEQAQHEAQLALVTECPPPPGYVRSPNGGPELLPAMTGAEQREFLARMGRPRK